LKTIVAEVPNSRFEELYGDFMAGAEEDVPFDM
jgi:hypothetical protein